MFACSECVTVSSCVRVCVVWGLLQVGEEAGVRGIRFNDVCGGLVGVHVDRVHGSCWYAFCISLRW
jgi:hypothetical protein